MAPRSSLHYRQCFRRDVPPPPSTPKMDAVLLRKAVNMYTLRHCKVSLVRNVLNSPYTKRNNGRPQAILQHNTSRYQGSVDTHSLVINTGTMSQKPNKTETPSDGLNSLQQVMYRLRGTEVKDIRGPPFQQV